MIIFCGSWEFYYQKQSLVHCSNIDKRYINLFNSWFVKINWIWIYIQENMGQKSDTSIESFFIVGWKKLKSLRLLAG